MPTNAMGREARGGGTAGGRSNADRDRDAARGMRDALGAGQAGRFSSGMRGATARRTAVPTRQYEMNLNNAAELAKTTIGFLGGPVTTAGKMIAGYGPQFTGYRGMGSAPGSYDPTNRALQTGNPGMAGGNGVPNTMARLFARPQGRGLQAGLPAAAAAGLQWTPQTYQPQPVNIPGGLPYSVGFNPWQYFK